MKHLLYFTYPCCAIVINSMTFYATSNSMYIPQSTANIEAELDLLGHFKLNLNDTVQQPE